MGLPLRRLLGLAGIGLAVGFFSGLFGVGGGIILVPLLMLTLGLSQRLAGGTSLAAVLPTAVAGLVGYAAIGNVDWLAGGVLALGAIGGSLVGTWLMHRIPQRLLRWIFVFFLGLVAVRMFFLVPDRTAELEFGVATIVGLLVLGLVVGIVSGLLGIGGGVIIVPALMLLFGVGDLVAKGTSLLMMIPTAVTGTLSNSRRRNVDLTAAAVIGLLAIPASFGGV
ncbi:MAG TPA: sulfite exporter TauE/SafE family protein, partial [Homoserinimonas sp.]|nr:sulfite exporter TauE/SafE family protein [Homoserinimonas sp.]